MTKVIIVISEGAMQDVYSTDKDVDVELLDYDNYRSLTPDPDSEDTNDRQDEYDEYSSLEKELKSNKDLHHVW